MKFYKKEEFKGNDESMVKVNKVNKFFETARGLQKTLQTVYRQ